MNNSWTTLSKNPKATKYALYVIIGLFSVLMIAQIASQLLTINQLNKVNGKVIAKREKITGYKGQKPHSANYSVLITLNNNQTYDVPLDESNWGIFDLIKTGDKATIYTPTALYNILSLDILDFGTRVSQFELNGHVFYSFANHQTDNLSDIAFLFIAMLPFCYLLYKTYTSD